VEESGLFDIKITDVSSTMLITLYCHAVESRSSNPIINDPEAERIIPALQSQLAASQDRMYRDLGQGKLNRKLTIFISLRARKFDDYARDFLGQHPDGAIVNLGCGLDTRFSRIDNGKLNFFDLDLPEVISIKKKLCSETDRYHMIDSSVLDYGWMERLKECKGPVLFLAEGLLMYLEEKDVKRLVLKLQSEFRGCELVCEVVNDSIAHGWLKGAMNIRLQKQVHLGRDVTFLSGLKDGRDMEAWSHGIKLLDEWSHFDSNEPKLGWVRLYGRIPGMRRIQWTTHYRLDQK